MTYSSLFFLLPYYLSSIFTELNLNHHLIYASHTQVVPLPRPAQVKTMKLGRPARFLPSRLLLPPTTLSRAWC